MAAAAMEAAKALATTDQYGRTIVTETRKFAGQNIQVCLFTSRNCQSMRTTTWEVLAEGRGTGVRPADWLLSDMQMKTAGVAGSGDVAQKTPTSGLDAMLAAIKGAKKAGPPWPCTLMSRALTILPFRSA